MAEDIYEVHVAKSGRWTLHERFRSSEKEDALLEAQRCMASPEIEAVRVIREVYDDNEQVFKQRTIYRNAKPKAAVQEKPKPVRPPPMRITNAQPRPAGNTAPAAPPPPPKPKAEPADNGVGRLLKRLGIATVTGAGVAGGGSLLAVSQGGDFVGGLLAEGNFYLLAMSMFVAAFVVSLYMFRRTSTPAEAEAARKAAADLEAAAAQVQANQAQAAPPVEEKPAPVEEVKPPEPEAIEPVVEPEEIAPEPAAAESDLEPVGGAAAEQDSLRLLRFFRDCLSNPSAQPFVAEGRMDPRTRFGCHLFLLGAGEAIIEAQRKVASPAGVPDLASVIQTALSLLGTEEDKAKGFAARIVEYRKDARYRAMIASGHKAMADLLAEKGLMATALGEALKVWNDANSRDVASDTIAIMFTDMVSSVQVTQALGDQGAMKVVQTHNLIVGAVLKQRRGHQVKHTGDGVMAVFPRVADGVAAAMDIQRQIAEHNRVTASTTLSIRIGVSAGQPIRENDDYFGTVVQLAARLCAAAQAGEILVGHAVVEAAGDAPFPFAEQQTVQLKGFTEPQQVHLVQWNQRAAPPPTGTPTADSTMPPPAQVSAGGAAAAVAALSAARSATPPATPAKPSIRA